MEENCKTKRKRLKQTSVSEKQQKRNESSPPPTKKKKVEEVSPYFQTEETQKSKASRKETSRPVEDPNVLSQIDKVKSRLEKFRNNNSSKLKTTQKNDVSKNLKVVIDVKQSKQTSERKKTNETSSKKKKTSSKSTVSKKKSVQKEVSSDSEWEEVES